MRNTMATRMTFKRPVPRLETARDRNKSFVGG